MGSVKDEQGGQSILGEVVGEVIGEVIAVGGGRDDCSGLIDAFALARVRADKPSVCFLPTASGDSEKQIDAFYDAFGSRGLASQTSAVHLSLFRRSRRDLADTLAAADVIVIGGGNAANLLALWRLHGVDALVLKAHRRGALLLAFSAGASALFERSVSDSFGGLSGLNGGLGILPGPFCAHYSSPRRAPKFRELAQREECFAEPGYAVDADAALHFVGGELAGALCWADGTMGYAVRAGRATPLSTRRLEQAR